jgi:hypothetical protein
MTPLSMSKLRVFSSTLSHVYTVCVCMCMCMCVKRILLYDVGRGETQHHTQEGNGEIAFVCRPVWCVRFIVHEVDAHYMCFYFVCVSCVKAEKVMKNTRTSHTNTHCTWHTQICACKHSAMRTMLVGTGLGTTRRHLSPLHRAQIRLLEIDFVSTRVWKHWEAIARNLRRSSHSFKGPKA